MRSRVILAAVVLMLVSQAAEAQRQCSGGGGSAYADGASSCLSAVRDGKVQQVLFTCRNGVWTDANLICPDRFAYFCQVGPHAVPVGERLLLGSGPAVLECKFPGVLSVSNQPASAPSAVPSAPSGRSELVRAVQRFLGRENAGLDCSGEQCAGEFDGNTSAAIVAYVSKNFERLTAEERKRWGIASQGETEHAVMSKSPIDVIHLFVGTFDVPIID